jgi:CubicO group peptidase (beta-lactamase class C family)
MLRPLLLRVLVPTVVIGAAVPAPLTAQTAAETVVPAADRFGEARASVRRLIEASNLPSAVVAVAKDGEIVWEEAFGWADVERQVPATPHTPYSIASISKPMTATAIMKLVEAGRLDLDRPANDYLHGVRITGLAGDAAGATVRRLLNHTAGLPLHYAFFYEGSAYPARGTDEGIARYGVVVHPPGSVYEYSNLGYGVLDRIIEQLSGRSYAEFMRDEVFAPLGMTQSSVGTGADLADAAVRYDARQRPIPHYDFDHRGGSAVYASARDLLRFGMAQLPEAGAHPRLLSDASLAAMQQVSTPGPAAQGYGLGWSVTEDDGGFRRVSHTGGMPGVTTALYLYPEQNLVVAAVTNVRDRAALQIAETAAAAVLPGYADSLRAQRANSLRENPPPSAFSPTPELLGEWRGTIRTHAGAVPITLRFRPDGEIHVQLQGQLRTLLDQATLRDGVLVGRFAGWIPTDDALRHRHVVQLSLRLQDDGRLAGQATAVAATEEIHFALSQYIELTKSEAGR